MRQAIDVDSRAGERGAISIKVAVMLFIAAAVVFAVIKVAPVYVEERDVLYRVDELARIAAVRGWKEDRINQDIEKLRNEFELPEKSITLVPDQKTIKISVGYTRPVNLLVTTYDWKVEYTATGKEL
jgi:hypothetical protein